MTYLVNPDAPKTQQVLSVVQEELLLEDYPFLIIGGYDPKIVENFLILNQQIVFVHNAEKEKLSDEEIGILEEKNIVYLLEEDSLKHRLSSQSQHSKTLFPSEILTSTISSLENGVLKCLQIAVNAVDKKIIPTGTRVISIAGENEELDTAVVLEPSSSRRILDTKIIKVLCRLYSMSW